MLTDQQNVAMMNPCIEAKDCLHWRYKRYMVPWSIILTLNSGFE